MYTIYWTPVVKEDLERLGKDIAVRIINKSEQIKYTPYHFLERLVDIKAWKLRVGDYRVIMDIDETKKELTVLMADHRKTIYKRLKGP